MKKIEGKNMMIEFVAVILAICAVGYAIHWHRERVKWARLRGEQLRKLKWLKEKIEGGK